MLLFWLLLLLIMATAIWQYNLFTQEEKRWEQAGALLQHQLAKHPAGGPAVDDAIESYNDAVETYEAHRRRRVGGTVAFLLNRGEKLPYGAQPAPVATEAHEVAHEAVAM